MTKQDMPTEVGKMFLQKITNYDTLIDAVKEKDRRRLLNAMMACSITDVQLIHLIPNLSESGLFSPLTNKQQIQLKRDIQKICEPWQKQS